MTDEWAEAHEAWLATLAADPADLALAADPVDLPAEERAPHPAQGLGR